MLVQRSNRGSTLLLVIAMLSILFLIGAALSFSTRLEGQASANYAELTQARMSATTGLPAAMPLITAASTGLTTTLQPWSMAPAEWNKTAQQGRNLAASDGSGGGNRSVSRSARILRDAGIGGQKLASGEMLNAPQVIFSISDMSSRVNVNSVRKEESLAKLIDAVLPATAGDSKAKARELFKLRGGEDVSTGAKRLDLRRGDGTGEPRVTSLASLAQKRGKNVAPLFSEEELRTLSNYLTVFSESPEVYNVEDGTSVPKIVLPQLTMESVLKGLRKAFPQKEEALLQQFAANITDFADADDIPTQVTALGPQSNQQPWRAIFGSEQTPLITEVYPDATTPVTNGDHGQFVEISNPWEKQMVLTGWRLSIGGGPSVTISQVLPPGGTLIITDNYDQPAQESQPGTGSFLSIFGARKDDGQRKVQVAGELNLPDRDNYVALYDGMGNLIDTFTYGSPGQLDTRVSLQREDPRLRASRPGDATPFEQGGAAGSKVQELRQAWKEGNQPLRSAADVFQVSTAYVSQTTGSTNALPSISGARPWQFPTLKVTDASMDRTNLDLRLIDLFTNWTGDDDEPSVVADANDRGASSRRQRNVASANSRRNESQAQTGRGQAAFQQNAQQYAAADDQSTTGSELVYSYGKLNLNTCAKASLLGLDLKMGGSQWPTSEGLEKFEAYRLKQIQSRKAPFTNVSDFVLEFFPTVTSRDLPELADLLDQVTVGSSAFEVTAQNRLSPEDSSAERDSNGRTPQQLTRRPAIAKARWLVTMDQHPYSLVQFTTVP